VGCHPFQRPRPPVSEGVPNGVPLLRFSGGARKFLHRVITARMSAIWRNSGLPGWLAPKVRFDFYDTATVEAPAPEIYEQWRLLDLIPVSDFWWYHKPTIELVRAANEAYARAMVDWSRGYDMHMECIEDGAVVWQRTKPWYCNL